MVMHNCVRIQQECIEIICGILGPDVYDSYIVNQQQSDHSCISSKNLLICNSLSSNGQ
jgi:hypothetical protein